MTGENQTEFRNEGEPAFEDIENDNSTDSSSEQTEEESTEATDGTEENQSDNTSKDDDLPFHEHPRWKQREDEWNDRFNEQEKRHQDDLKAITEKIDGSKQESQSSEVPEWFGGDQSQYNAYLKDRDKIVQEAEERALKRLTETKKSEEDKVKEATDFMKSEVAAIESDKDLNPTGSKIDVNKLVKTTIDNDLIDSKGRWNYKAGYRIMNAGSNPKPKTSEDRKKLAGATSSDDNAEDKKTSYKTSEDFKTERPW